MPVSGGQISKVYISTAAYFSAEGSDAVGLFAAEVDLTIYFRDLLHRG